MIKTLFDCKLALLALALAVCTAPVTSQQGKTTYTNSSREFRGPLAYKEKKSGVLFYVESDGRHVSAIGPNAKVLWTKDPYKQAGMEPYRVANPRIVYIGAGKRRPTQLDGSERTALAIVFDSTQFGQMNMETGEFDFLGQD